MGYPMPEALIGARVIYYAQIGFYALDVTEPMETQLSYIGPYFLCFTGRELDDDWLATFRGRITERLLYEGIS